MRIECHRTRLRRSGSAILGVVLFSVFAFTILATLMPSIVTEYRANIRNRLLTVAVGVSEYGCRQAVWALNNYEDKSDWTNAGWSFADEDDGDSVILREYTIAEGGDSTFILDGNETARVRVILRDWVDMSVQVVSESTVYRDGMEISQLVVMRVANTTPFMGLIAKNSLSFSGQPKFDSFNSTVFPYTYAYGVNTGKNVTVGSISTTSGSVSLGNAYIYGNVVSGAEDPLVSGAVSGGKEISGSVVGEFYMDFPDVKAPDTSGWVTSF